MKTQDYRFGKHDHFQISIIDPTMIFHEHHAPKSGGATTVTGLR
jgi:hypothetical protein